MSEEESAILTDTGFHQEDLDLLVCPETKQKLFLCTWTEAEERMVGSGDLAARGSTDKKPFGRTSHLLVREDLKIAYPIVDGIPILLLPEMITRQEYRRDFDLTAPQYAEAYSEMEFYNEVASREADRILESEAYSIIAPLLEAPPEAIDSFPHPRELWLDSTYDCASQWDAYQHIAPVKGKRVLQLGGMGIHAVKFLLAGAKEAWVLSPMLGEVKVSFALAQAAGVAERLRAVVAVAEEVSLASETFDVVYSGGCVHHMVTSIALPEAARILKRGGKFAAMDPWRAPLYAIGTKLLGKREPEVFCRPLTRSRVEPVYGAFSKADVIQHGALTRYPLLALSKFGVSSSLSTVWRFNRVDDAVCSLIPGMRKMGSSVALLGTK